MTTKITVNGVDYDSVEAMPAHVRQVYDEIRAKFPNLAAPDGEGVQEIVQGRFGPIQGMTTIQKKIIVNGQTYESEAAMPPEVHQAFELAKKSAHPGQPTVKSEIKMSFNITGPGLTFHKTLGGSPRLPGGQATRLSGIPTPTPIEPTSGERGLRLAFVVAACVAALLGLWLLTKAH